MKFYLKILSGPFLCCHEQMMKNLEAPSRRCFGRPTQGEKRDQFCALMYEDTCQKKERKQISSTRQEGFRPTRVKGEAKQKSKQIQGF